MSSGECHVAVVEWLLAPGAPPVQPAARVQGQPAFDLSGRAPFLALSLPDANKAKPTFLPPSFDNDLQAVATCSRC